MEKLSLDEDARATLGSPVATGQDHRVRRRRRSTRGWRFADDGGVRKVAGYEVRGKWSRERTALGWRWRRRLTCRAAASLRRCPLSLVLAEFPSLLTSLPHEPTNTGSDDRRTRNNPAPGCNSSTHSVTVAARRHQLNVSALRYS